MRAGYLDFVKKGVSFPAGETNALRAGALCETNSRRIYRKEDNPISMNVRSASTEPKTNFMIIRLFGPKNQTKFKTEPVFHRFHPLSCSGSEGTLSL